MRDDKFLSVEHCRDIIMSPSSKNDQIERNIFYQLINHIFMIAFPSWRESRRSSQTQPISRQTFAPRITVEYADMISELGDLGDIVSEAKLVVWILINAF